MATSAEAPFPSATMSAKAANSRGNGRTPDTSEEAVPPQSADCRDVQGDALNRVVQGAHQTIDRLAESAAPHAQRLQDGVSTAGNLLHDRAEQARRLGDEWAETLRCTVRENPLAAVGTALALGALVTRLLRR